MKNIITWNVNGIRAAEKKGLFSWFAKTAPDILCLQETKAQPDQLSETFIDFPGYSCYWESAQKKGYSSVAVYSRHKPLSVGNLGIKEYDDEGRCQVLEYQDFVLFNCYFPNSQEGGARLDYKLGFCAAVLDKTSKLAARGTSVLVCGDYNIAHKPIDLAHPKQNETNPGYLPEERAWMDSFIQAGFVDAFRLFVKEGGHYTWWTYRSNARANNVGWRIDYHCVNEAFASRVKSVSILSDVLGSDHCPVSITLA
ncbi:MAG: exodeoxyribonuclease III [Spirochaetales bacterium]|nr:MAG: exodeoxyribonuclease III [Spirochaetales bacterium]